MARITLITDFGTVDGYVGVMKGVMASLAPQLFLDDVTHDIPPGDVEKASRVLGRVWSRFPQGTVHLVVVDPGVGTDRRGLALEAGGDLAAWVAAEHGRRDPKMGFRAFLLTRGYLLFAFHRKVKKFLIFGSLNDL